MAFKRSSGVLVHPTSFPSKFGIGDLGQSAFDFIDFMKKSKQALWQVLPLNPTSFGDSPYQSFSTFAGNTLLISPEELVKEKYLKESDLELAKAEEFDDNKVDYGKVITYKSNLFKKAYETFITDSTDKQKLMYSDFCNKNKDWLEDYSLFIAIKYYLIAERKNSFESIEYKAYYEKYKNFLSLDSIKDNFYGASWLSWDKDIIDREDKAIEKWTQNLSYDINKEKFLQYEFFRQWHKLKDYANENEIKIIGDIPIYVAQDSADVWANKELFLVDKDGAPSSVAGVPPDYFSATGQLWGNPLYDWSKHEATGFKWWIKRIKQTLLSVDILRIDHFRGFESYWSIPAKDKTAMNGKWLKGPGEKLFVAIKNELGDLPIIAEDLGIITKEVEELITKLGFPGMKVLQFGFDGKQNNMNLPHHFKTSNLVIYTGTHDNDTTLGWYSTAPEKAKDQFRRFMNVSGDNCSWDLIRLAFLSCADIAIVPIQDVMSLGVEARMNRPGILSDNWQFRYTADMLTEIHAESLAYISKLSDRYIIEEEIEEDIEEKLEEELTEDSQDINE